jgi:uroporphyrin-III C-methyltransferase/precorrin-2 dehydrogenase/sirohydrochlorin ferrochelatase
MSMPPAIAPLGSLPLFHRLAGSKAVVAGSSRGAEWKAELLAAAGAAVERLDQSWSDEQLAGAAIAVADLSDPVEESRFALAARRAGALVSIIDRPDLSDVQFGSIVNRSPVVIAISTDGAAPVLAQSIRARIEAILPPGLSNWAKAAREWRPLVKERLSDFGARRRFWQGFVAAFWASPGRAPGEPEFEALIDGTSAVSGRVTLVGAGPGDPGLLTLKAVRALQSATVILHDRLVGDGVLELARREARRIAVGKAGHGPSCKQNEISELMVKLALAGEDVVRLKGGDPLIFGRAAEEIDACREAGVDVCVIPGISAAQAAAASLRISLTERRHARRVQFVTGHGADGRLPADIDWQSIVDRRATTVLYMPRHTLDEFVRKALSKGLDPATPAIAIASASLPDEVHAVAEIAEIGALAELLPASAPVSLIIGWTGRRLIHDTATIVPLRKACVP